MVPDQIQLKEIFETDTDIALVLELVTGGELFDRCAQAPPPQEVTSLADQLSLCFSSCRIVERGYYSERDAAHVIKQILEAVAVRNLLLLPLVPLSSSWCSSPCS